MVSPTLTVGFLIEAASNFFFQIWQLFIKINVTHKQNKPLVYRKLGDFIFFISKRNQIWVLLNSMSFRAVRRSTLVEVRTGEY